MYHALFKLALRPFHMAPNSGGAGEPCHGAPKSQRQEQTVNLEPEIEPMQKKPRTTFQQEENLTNVSIQPCPLFKLPLELLAEILIVTSSPKDVLAVARSCKFFCATLVQPLSAFIWRTVRKLCRPQALPDPFSTFTEASYAAFVFDGGCCEVSFLGDMIHNG